MSERLTTIKQKLSLLPITPGCYLMKDKKGKIIYVGKAKKLRNRVSQYFNKVHNYKTQKMVELIHDFDYIVVPTEKEALILEIDLIKEHTPRFNIMFMDDSYYPYIQITNETHPKLKIVRNAKDRKAKTFGPFPDATAARETYKLLNRLFPLRKCNKLPKKECLYYHLHQCLGPCVEEVNPELYKEMITSIEKILKGDTKEIKNTLKEKMDIASDRLDFEKAKEYRDLINYINHVNNKQIVQASGNTNCDIVGFKEDKGYLSLQMIFMRNGKIMAHQNKMIPLYGEVDETISSFLMNYYQNNTLPKEILIDKTINIDLIGEIHNIKILYPERGAKRKLIQMAEKNANEALVNDFLLFDKQLDKNQIALEQLQKLLNIDYPQRIEMFDNSNISGSSAVSGMIVMTNGKFDKNEYRKYNIKTVEGPDDYASMKEVFYRRAMKFLTTDTKRPDLMIVDGGKGQVTAAKSVLDSLHLNIPVCGLAKDNKHHTDAIINSDLETIPLDKKSNLYFLLANLQEEVHRFAISFHQQKRKKTLFNSILDDIEGIGPKRKKQLLNKFGSVKKMKDAGVEELKTVLPDNIAEVLYIRLTEGSD